MKNSTNPIHVAEALTALQRLIANGWEFSDARWYAAYVYHVDADALQEAYDQGEQA